MTNDTVVSRVADGASRERRLIEPEVSDVDLQVDSKIVDEDLRKVTVTKVTDETKDMVQDLNVGQVVLKDVERIEDEGVTSTSIVD